MKRRVRAAPGERPRSARAPGTPRAGVKRTLPPPGKQGSSRIDGTTFRPDRPALSETGLKKRD